MSKKKNNSQNLNENTENKKKEKKERKWHLYAIILALIIIIILLLVRSCGGPVGSSDSTQPVIDDKGQYEIGDKREEVPDENVEKQDDKITFAGYGKYSLNSKKTDVEFKNPIQNTVDMVFTVMDAKTGEEIAKTLKVAPGKYAYVNVYDYYKEKGTYEVNVNVSTFAEDGSPRNGVNQKMEIEIE